MLESAGPMFCPKCKAEYLYGVKEVCTTLNVSRNGLYFATTTQHYFPGMNVIVTFDFRSDDPMQREYLGDVVRLERLEDGKWGGRDPHFDALQSPRTLAMIVSWIR